MKQRIRQMEEELNSLREENSAFRNPLRTPLLERGRFPSKTMKRNKKVIVTQVEDRGRESKVEASLGLKKEK